jgi:hypothetical protein
MAKIEEEGKCTADIPASVFRSLSENLAHHCWQGEFREICLSDFNDIVNTFLLNSQRTYLLYPEAHFSFYDYN